MRQLMLPSPRHVGLGHRTLHITRQPVRSLALRPGDSLTIPYDGFVDRLQTSQFPSWLLSKLRGVWLLPRWDSLPLNTPAFAGHTVAIARLLSAIKTARAAFDALKLATPDDVVVAIDEILEPVARGWEKVDELAPIG